MDRAVEERTLRIDRDINVTCLIGVWISGTKTEFAEEVAARVSDTNEQKSCRRADGGVDAVLDGGKDGDKDSRGPYAELEGRDTPEVVHLFRRSNKIGYGVNDDCR